MSLFNFEERTEGTKGALNIYPNGSTDPDNPRSKVVNVVNDYAWTIQPKSARKDVPYLYMIERKLTNDVMIQQLMYNISAAFQTGVGISEDALKTITGLLKIGEDENKSKKENEAAIKKKKDEITANLQDNGLLPENPYTGLYNLEDTGWAYVLPYFDKNNHNIDGDWNLPQDSEGGSITSKLGSAASDAIGNIASNVNRITSALGVLSGNKDISKPGTYIEKAKQYNFKAQGPSYSVNFNLYNTGKITDVIENWELCFALMYNLLPNRKSKTVFDPPPLYEVYIPGVRRSPVSFIKGMKVEFLGATRIMDLSVAGQDKLRTIVPDAYSIQIDIEDVLPESKNFMQSMVTGDRVQVSVKGSNFAANPSGVAEKTANEITHITLNPTQKNGTVSLDKESPSIIETVSEPVKRAYRSIQRNVKDINKIPRGRF